MAFVLGLGIELVKLFDHIYGYKMPIDNINSVQCYFLVALAALSLFYNLFRRGRKNSKSPAMINLSPCVERSHGVKLLALVSVAAVGLYVLLSGFSFGAQGYESRYDNARGAGLLLLFFPAFLPYYCSLLINAKNSRELNATAFFFFLYGLFIYFVLNGYRQILIAVALIFIIFLLYRRVIGLAHLLVSVFVVMPAFLVGLSLLRYSGESSSEFADLMTASFYYIQGDLFPVDAVMKMDFYLSIYDPPGMSIFWEHFYRFIPRFLFPEKPDILNNAAGFYTTVVVEYDRGVTLSPTILSEGLMVGGLPGVIFVSSVAGIFCAVYDRLLLCGDRAIFVPCLVSGLYSGFFIVREGLQAGLYRLMVLLVFVLLAMMLDRLFGLFLRKRFVI